MSEIETENKYTIFSSLALRLLSILNTYILKFYLLFYFKKEENYTYLIIRAKYSSVRPSQRILLTLYIQVWLISECEIVQHRWTFFTHKTTQSKSTTISTSYLRYSSLDKQKKNLFCSEPLKRSHGTGFYRDELIVRSNSRQMHV